MAKAIKVIFTIIAVIAVALVALYVIGFRFETYEMFGEHAAVLFLKGDIIDYWTW